ncbi:hypothetical protein K3495_g7369 [Podosphaera aphanis]|nr:hypothetical protein K3495_g7369 [Podosphaera aphanis]
MDAIAAVPLSVTVAFEFAAKFVAGLSAGLVFPWKKVFIPAPEPAMPQHKKI